MKLKDEILSAYNVKDKRVVKFIEKTVSALESQKVEVTDYTKMILNLLVVQLILYYKSSDEIVDTDSVTTEDSYKRSSKLPAISTMQKANDQILTLLDKITLSPLSSAKVKKLRKNDDDGSDEMLLADLIK